MPTVVDRLRFFADCFDFLTSSATRCVVDAALNVRWYCGVVDGVDDVEKRRNVVDRSSIRSLPPTISTRNTIRNWEKSKTKFKSKKKKKKKKNHKRQ